MKIIDLREFANSSSFDRNIDYKKLSQILIIALYDVYEKMQTTTIQEDDHCFSTYRWLFNRLKVNVEELFICDETEIESITKQVENSKEKLLKWKLICSQKLIKEKKKSE